MRGADSSETSYRIPPENTSTRLIITTIYNRITMLRLYHHYQSSERYTPCCYFVLHKHKVWNHVLTCKRKSIIIVRFFLYCENDSDKENVPSYIWLRLIKQQTKYISLQANLYHHVRQHAITHNDNFFFISLGITPKFDMIWNIFNFFI